MNKKIINEFEKLIKQIKYEADHTNKKDSKKIISNNFRLSQSIKILEILKNYPTEITSSDQLEGIKGIGKGTINRINEILKYGYLKEINIGKGEEKYLKEIDELTQVYGIGNSKAFELINNYNITNIKQLKKMYEKGKIQLSNNIILGLKYHGVYKQVIPREEIDNINLFLKKIVNSIAKYKLNVTICGSYRREKPYSNDIDILLTSENIVDSYVFEKNVSDFNKSYIRLFVKKLKEKNFIIDDIDFDYRVKYMGFCKFKNNPVRRIDIMFVPYESYFTALLHFTGSGDFNRKVRRLALELGYSLNQYRLHDLENNKSVPIKSEEELFEKLGMEYIPPSGRNK